MPPARCDELMSTAAGLGDPRAPFWGRRNSRRGAQSQRDAATRAAAETGAPKEESRGGLFPSGVHFQSVGDDRIRGRQNRAHEWHNRSTIEASQRRVQRLVSASMLVSSNLHEWEFLRPRADKHQQKDGSDQCDSSISFKLENEIFPPFLLFSEDEG